jgi:hypothetical protein
MFRAACLVSLLAALPVQAAAPPGPSFALRDGDTVVFLGDSITATRSRRTAGPWEPTRRRNWKWG